MMSGQWGTQEYLKLNYIALGTLLSTDTVTFHDWTELSHPIPSILIHSCSDNLVTSHLESNVQGLLKDGQIRIHARTFDNLTVLRIFLLATDATRPSGDITDIPVAELFWRFRKWPNHHLERILPFINISPLAWEAEAEVTDHRLFDPFGTIDDGSLFYIFNTLPSPSPHPNQIKESSGKEAVKELLDSSRPVLGLKTQLYPYQARSAAQMIQQESCPKLHVDPRYEERKAPDGETYWYNPRSLSFCKDAPSYESNRGGILAETMGLGKTIICLTVILATKNHLPRIPPQAVYETREAVPSLLHLALQSCGKHAVPVRSRLERLERLKGVEYKSLLRYWEDNPIEYLIPGKPPRSLRRATTPPPTKMTLSSGTIIVVPRNLVGIFDHLQHLLIF
jgi:hypothetical protein